MPAGGRAAVAGDHRYGWVLVGTLGVTEAVSWGVLYYAFAVFLIPMHLDLGFPVIQLSAAFSLALAVSALAGLAVGHWLDRHSPTVLMASGSLLAAVAVLAWSRIDSLAALYVVFVGIGLAMAMVLYEPAFIVITKWFTVRRRQALTVLTLVAAPSSLIFSPLSERLIAALGWREALVVLAVILAMVTVPLHALFLRPSPHEAATGVGHQHTVTTSVHRIRGLWWLAAAFGLASFAVGAMGVHIVALLIEAGHGSAFAALIAGLIGISQIPGRMLFGVAAGRLSRAPLVIAVFGLGVAGLLVLGSERSPLTGITFAVLFGMSSGMATLLRATLIGDLYGPTRYGLISSVPSAFVTGGRAAAPLAGALVALLAGGYGALPWLLAGSLVLASVCAFIALEHASGEQRTRPA